MKPPRLQNWRMCHGNMMANCEFDFEFIILANKDSLNWNSTFWNCIPKPVEYKIGVGKFSSFISFSFVPRSQDDCNVQFWDKVARSFKLNFAMFSSHFQIEIKISFTNSTYNLTTLARCTSLQVMPKNDLK